MLDRATDPRYLAYQYGDSEKLKIRLETHEQYSEHVNQDWHRHFTAQLTPAAGDTVLDVGCGFGAFHPALCAVGARVLAFDFSPGMAQESVRNAVSAGLDVRVLRADAQQIPLADCSVDHALASHMLYHVPDIERALMEMRRVVKPGGRVLLITNAADHSARLRDLHERAAHDCGYTSAVAFPTTRFSLDHLPLVRSVFPNAQLLRLPNAFLFPTVEPALRYYASGFVDSIEDRPEDGSHRAPMLQRMSELIQEIVDREGVFRVPKDAGAFPATVEA
ncbi:MAG: methyltransferase domain-containing protein [Chloroflexota bacterium]